MLNEKVKLLARRLLARGIKPLWINRWTEFSDPSIQITESIYVQVGIEYVMIFSYKSSVGLVMYEASMKTDDVITKLKQAIEESKI